MSTQISVKHRHFKKMALVTVMAAAITSSLTTAARADWDDDYNWHPRREYHEEVPYHEHYHEHHDHDRDRWEWHNGRWYIYEHPVYQYAPVPYPPHVVYQPPVVVEETVPSPAINFFIPLNIR